jgi:hypothetical protein
VATHEAGQWGSGAQLLLCQRATRAQAGPLLLPLLLLPGLLLPHAALLLSPALLLPDTHLTSRSASDCTGMGVSIMPGLLSPSPSCPLLLFPQVYSCPSQLRPAPCASLSAIAAQRPTACAQVRTAAKEGAGSGHSKHAG